MDFTVPDDHRVKLKGSEKNDKWLNFVRELKNIPNVIGALGTDTKGFITFITRGLENNWTSEDHPNYCVIEIDQNTEKSPEDLRRLATTQTLVKNHQKLWCEKLSGSKMIILFAYVIIEQFYTSKA